MTWDMAIAFVFGLLIGSFLKVVIYRLPHMILADSDTPRPMKALSFAGLLPTALSAITH